MLAVFLLGNLWEYAVPFNQKHGVEFNAERRVKNIPPLNHGWNLEQYNSSQFKRVFYNPKSKEMHFKKIIEYNYSDIKSESNFYKFESDSVNFVCSTYDFENDSFKYFLERRAQQIVSVNKAGKFYYNKATKLVQISESDFLTLIKK